MFQRMRVEKWNLYSDLFQLLNIIMIIIYFGYFIRCCVLCVSRVFTEIPEIQICKVFRNICSGRYLWEWRQFFWLLLSKDMYNKPLMFMHLRETLIYEYVGNTRNIKNIQEI